MEKYDESLKAGQQVQLGTIGHLTNDAVITAKVAEVYHGRRKYENMGVLYTSYELPSSFQYMYVIAPKQMAWKIASQQMTEEAFRQIEMNDMQGQFSRLASFESTDKQIVQFAKKYKFDYSTMYGEIRRMNYQKIVQNISIYGSLMILVLCVFLILQKNFADGIS